MYNATALGSQAPPIPDAVTFEVISVPRPDGSILPVHHFRPATQKHGTPTAALLHFHGGGFIAMTPDIAKGRLVQYVLNAGIQAFSVDYRLAPEHPYPAALDDGWTALAWIRENAGQLGINTARIAIMGDSAGGAIAVSLAIRARDSQLSPPIAQQILCAPMLDDRTKRDIPCNFKVWDLQDNITGWTAYLGKPPGGSDVPDTASPARVTDVSGLPSLYIDTTQLDLFAEENMEYGSRCVKAGIEVEIHVSPGLPHGFDSLMPSHRVSKQYEEHRERVMRNL
ncbi:Alpha/Beta hydrolase protein [Plectosphaerella cucumerina]|uniref:Alpha/Beta hydrolase protein n=1 Tax=Plectosphaerella cucumerina TaxID=40658 RepID=A0A8K0X594_9PEZI|nr:Alpha/Beta hydrolase protein [Plectosphaerella cucumerina]